MHGGRWNPPASFAVLYLNADVLTARLRLERLLDGSPVGIDDLDEDAFVLVAATLPRGQVVADSLSPAGLDSLGLPATYPLEANGLEVSHDVCQRIGRRVHDTALRGVYCRSAAQADGTARELAWFPARPASRARAVWERPLALGAWRHAAGWGELGLEDQAGPVA